MQLTYRLLLWALAAGMWLAALPAAAADLAVENIRYGHQGEGTRIVIDFNRPADFRAFLLDAPWRLAVDLPPARWKIPQSSGNGQKAVKGYRSGVMQKDALTRIVFDLSGPAIVTRAFTLPADDFSPSRVVIDLMPASQTLFSARTAEVFGNRDLKADGAQARVPPPSMLAASRSLALSAITLPVRKPGREGGKYTVVVDAGHGGGDPGAIASGVTEKHLTLRAARELRRQLEETGRYRVVLTRDKDEYIKLRRRLALSREAGADLFISLHADKIGRKNVRGASIYTLSENASDSETARLAESENNAGVVAGVDLAAESADVADILLDLAMREKMNESNLFARLMEQALHRNKIRLLPNSHRSAGFAVLKAPDVPAILIEMGFLSNPQEAKLLDSAAFQRQLAAAMVEGVDAYFRKMQALQKVN